MAASTHQERTCRINQIIWIIIKKYNVEHKTCSKLSDHHWSSFVTYPLYTYCMPSLDHFGWSPWGRTKMMWNIHHLFMFRMENHGYFYMYVHVYPRVYIYILCMLPNVYNTSHSCCKGMVTIGHIQYIYYNYFHDKWYTITAWTYISH